jgi:hypothetical protein
VIADNRFPSNSFGACYFQARFLLAFYSTVLAPREKPVNMSAIAAQLVRAMARLRRD